MTVPWPFLWQNINMQQTALPIQPILAPLQQALAHSAVVLQAPPGAGKSTALPLYLLQHNPDTRWIMVQPRRLAALSIAQYLSAQLEQPVGQTVGYQVRQQRQRSAATRLLIVTEGMLTRMLQSDPTLSDFDGVIFDEFHERNLHSDLGLALVLESRQIRDDLKLLVMSATLPAADLATWLQEQGTRCEVLHSDGRAYPVDIQYEPPTATQTYLEKCAQVIRRLLTQPDGPQGMLVFVPGQSEIAWLQRELTSLVQQHPDLDCFGLHAGLSLSDQQQVLQAPARGKRRIIISTNIAETSLTIAGIDYVIDSGRERQALYRPKYHTTELITRRVAKAAATQRAGRAGRTGPGGCTRVYAQSDWHGMADYRPADIEQQELTDLSLQVACWGAQMQDMAWFTPPNPSHVAAAHEWLRAIGALNAQAQATPYGQSIANAAADVRAAHAIAQVQQDDALSQRQRDATMLAIAYWLSLEEGRESQQVNGLDAIEQLQQQPATMPRTRQRLKYWLHQFELTDSHTLDSDSVIQAAIRLYPLGLARLRGGSANFTLATGAGVSWPSGHGQSLALSKSLSQAAWLIVTQISMHEQHSQGVIRQALALTKAQAEALFAGVLASQLQQQVEHVWRSANGGLEQVERTMYSSLVIQQRASQQLPDRAAISDAMVAYVQQHGIATLGWTPHCVQYLRRLQRFQQAHPELGLRLSDSELLSTLAQWAAPFWAHLTTLAQLRQWAPQPALAQLLDYAQQQQLEQLLPARWVAPSGRAHRIEYQADGSAFVGLKLQEVFGTAQTPKLLNGQLPLTFELLSPAGRPLQRTSDLANFWQGAYVSVKKEMRGRYPKHPWPDDPTTAPATHLTKKALHGQSK